MTIPQVWVSTASPQINYDGQTPGDHWELVGTIDTSAESDFFTYVQVFITDRRTTRGRPEFYLDGDPESGWVQASNRGPCWVAIDPWGESRKYIHGARPMFLVSRAQAVVRSLARRAPEAHPSHDVRPVKIPIGLKRINGEVFTRWVQQDS